MIILIAFILMVCFLFALACGVILLVHLGEFLISYYGTVIFAVPFAISITLSILCVIFYFAGQRQKKKKIDAINEIIEKTRVMKEDKK